MKKQIRFNIYETASSSVHALVVSTKHMHKSKLKIADDGYVHVNLTEYYGKDEKDYKGQREKLTYVVTWMYIYFGCSIEKLYDKYLWKDFDNAFADYVGNGCKGIWIDKTMLDGGEMAGDYLDHQSIPYGEYDSENCIVNLYDTEQLINFIFNPYLWLHTDCD